MTTTVITITIGPYVDDEGFVNYLLGEIDNAIESTDVAGIPVTITRPHDVLPAIKHHKATPVVEDQDRGARASLCRYCNERIIVVPGGHGPTWVHTDTGAVAGSGAPTKETS